MRRIKPTRRPALRTIPQLVFGGFLLCVVTASYFGVLGERLRVLYLVIPGAIAILEILRVVSRNRSGRPKRGFELKVEKDHLSQFDEDRLICEIDLLRPYEYKILDRYDLKDSLFALYQDSIEMTFYISDPGGLKVVREVLQIEWPPRDRHVSRSFPPAAA